MVGLGPVGWIAIGASVALPFLHLLGSPRGDFQKFDREVSPAMASLARYTSLETMTGWFNELVGVDPEGNRKVYGSWIGEGPEWGTKAAARVMELGRENFLWSFQPGRSDGPWVLIGPHPVLGSVVYDVFAAIKSATDYWDSERERMMREWEGGQPPAPPADPPFLEETIDPGEVSAPPDPATPIDPPAPPPIDPLPLPKKRGIWQIIGGVLAGVFGAGGILGGRGGPGAGGYPRTYPPGGLGGGLGGDNMLYLAAAGVLVLAAMKRKKRRTHGEARS